ncbi:hypothetical protein [Rhodocaloribacter sp.]
MLPFDERRDVDRPNDSEPREDERRDEPRTTPRLLLERDDERARVALRPVVVRPWFRLVERTVLRVRCVTPSLPAAVPEEPLLTMVRPLERVVTRVSSPALRPTPLRVEPSRTYPRVPRRALASAVRPSVLPRGRYSRFGRTTTTAPPP